MLTLLLAGLVNADDPGTAAVDAPLRASVEARYTQLALHRTEGRIWRVEDGGGAVIDPADWGRLTGDGRPLARAEQAAPLTQGWEVRVAGLGLGLVSALLVVNLPETDGANPRREGKVIAETRARLGLFALAEGAAFGMIAISFRPGPVPRGTPLRPYLDPATADATIAVYNAHLAARLGLDGPPTPPALPPAR